MDSEDHNVMARTPGTFLFAVLILSFSLAPMAGAEEGGEVLAYQSSVADMDLPPHAMRGRGARVRIEPKEFDADRLMFRFPDGTGRMARRSRVIERGRLRSWVGIFEGRPGSVAVVSQRDGETTGFLDDGQRIFEIRPGPAGETLIYEVDPSALPRRGSPLSPSLDNRKFGTQQSIPTDSDVPTQGPTQFPVLQ
jgi:hypothetical protein